MRFTVLLITSFCVLGSQAWVKEMENDGLYEGDMLLSVEQQQQVKDGTFGYGAKLGMQWPKGIIYYTIASNLAKVDAAVEAITDAIKEYHTKTCIIFKKRTDKRERAYIEFFYGFGCFAAVGYNGGRSRISLGQGCWRKSTAVHEIAHSLGFYHEQNRPDRDQFVNIHWKNIRPHNIYNFKIRKDIDSLNSPYDYNSVMHYKWNAFSNNGQATITRKDGGNELKLGNNSGLSTEDARQMNLLYKEQCGSIEMEHWVKMGKRRKR